VLEISITNIKEQLSQSEIYGKNMELEDVKKNIDALKILVEAQFESLKEIRENQNNNLSYIF
jgi:hypothetical protein